MLVRQITDQENNDYENCWSEKAGTEIYCSGKYWLGQLLVGKIPVRKITDQENIDRKNDGTANSDQDNTY